MSRIIQARLQEPLEKTLFYARCRSEITVRNLEESMIKK